MKIKIIILNLFFLSAFYSTACDLVNNVHTLECAILLNNIEHAQELIMHNNFEPYDYNFETPLHWCAKVGRSELIPLLLQKIDINSLNVQHNTPLYISLIYTETACAQLLINNGAQLDLKNVHLKNSLHLAAHSDYNVIILEQLLQKNVPANLSDINGNTPLHIAARQGAFNNAVKLLDHYVDASLENNYEETPLIMLYQSKEWKTKKINQKKLALLILANLIYKQSMSLESYINKANLHHKTAQDYAKENGYLFHLPNTESALRNALVIWFESSFENSYHYLKNRELTGKSH